MFLFWLELKKSSKVKCWSRSSIFQLVNVSNHFGFTKFKDKLILAELAQWYKQVIAKVQNTCNLIGREEYCIGHHCVKNFLSWSFFLPVFPYISTRKNSRFRHFSHSACYAVAVNTVLLEKNESNIPMPWQEKREIY